MTLKCECVFDLILTDDEGISKSVIKFSFVIFADEMHNFSKRRWFYLSTVFIEIGVISALGKHNPAWAAFQLSQCPVPQKADNMNIGVVPQHFQWRNSWVIVGEVHGDFD